MWILHTWRGAELYGNLLQRPSQPQQSNSSVYNNEEGKYLALQVSLVQCHSAPTHIDTTHIEGQKFMEISGHHAPLSPNKENLVYITH